MEDRAVHNHSDSTSRANIRGRQPDNTQEQENVECPSPPPLSEQGPHHMSPLIDERDFRYKFRFENKLDSVLDAHRSTRRGPLSDNMYSYSTLEASDSGPNQSPSPNRLVSATELEHEGSNARGPARPPLGYSPTGPTPADGVSVLLPQEQDSTRPLSPRMNIALLAAGPLDDLHSYIELGKLLESQFGHLVRLAAHTEFRSLVESGGVEFVDLGELRGLLTGEDALLRRDLVSELRFVIGDILSGCLEACMGTSTKVGDQEARGFVADAIIATPLSFGHIHCAERLGVPLHIMTHHPFTPTVEFPHPLAARAQSSQLGSEGFMQPKPAANFLSYTVAETYLWHHLGDKINSFRTGPLGLEPLSLTFGPGILHRLGIPVAYFSLPQGVNRPFDWGPHVAVSRSPSPSSPPTAASAARHFHVILNHALSQGRCDVAPHLRATLADRGRGLRLSSAVAAVLVGEKKVLGAHELQPFRSVDYDLAMQPVEPLSSLASSAYDGIANILLGATAGPREAYLQARSASPALPLAGGSDMVQTYGATTTTATMATESDTASAISGKGNSNGKSLARAARSVTVETTKGVGKMLRESARLPVSVTHGGAQGFHNAPRLYGDDTVRAQGRITGWKSGLAAGGKNFTLGLYDGISGVVTQPIRGAKKEGAVGFIKGFGKGLGGVVLKPAAGAFGLLGSPLMGIYKELHQRGEPDIDAFAVATRLADGQAERSLLGQMDAAYIVVMYRKKVNEAGGGLR